MVERFDDLPILDELGEALTIAFTRVEQRRTWWQRVLALFGVRGLGVAIVLAVGVGGTTAAAALLALRATGITAPRAQDLSPPMRAVPGSGVVAHVRAADPDGAPPWAIRTTRSATGLTCSAVGQVVDRSFGIVGLDGRFRVLPERIVDGCGAATRDRAVLLGARIFDADQQPRVRTIVNGVAGKNLRSVELRASGTRRILPISPGGVFIAVLRGYPEDSAPEITLRFVDGSTQRQRFGTEPGVVRDPFGGPALQTELLVVPGPPTTRRCVHFFAARTSPNGLTGPDACAIQRADSFFFGARRFSPGQRSNLRQPGSAWAWKRNPSRTVVWGWARRPASLVLLGDGAPRPIARAADGTFVAILPARVDPRALRVRAVDEDGTVRTVRAGEALSDPPPPRRKRP